MDAADFQRDLEAAKDTELERLASSKLLVALTDADLTAERVLRIAADSECAAAETFGVWAEDESDDEARELFADLRDQEREHCERVLDLLEGDDGEKYDPDATGGPMHDRLRALEEAVPRLGGLVGRALVTERTHLQVVSFFVNESNERRAEAFRDLRTETAAQGERAAELLAETCEGDADRDRAAEAAEAVIDAAYDAYADSLDDLGIDPKPIC
ncbi:rubrerythrin family protein [Halopiger thermotolerans]